MGPQACPSARLRTRGPDGPPGPQRGREERVLGSAGCTGGRWGHPGQVGMACASPRPGAPARTRRRRPSPKGQDRVDGGAAGHVLQSSGLTRCRCGRWLFFHLSGKGLPRFK